MNEVDHCPYFGLSNEEFARSLKVGGDSLFEILGFADVDRLAKPVFH